MSGHESPISRGKSLRSSNKAIIKTPEKITIITIIIIIQKKKK